MNGNKLVQALSTFNKEEWISYRKYLLMNTSEDSDNYRVFTFLQVRKDKLNQIPNLEKVRNKHFDTLSTKSLSNTLSRLYKWLEEWLVYYSLKNDKIESDLILVRNLNRRGLYNLADQKAKQLQKQLDQEDGLSISKSRIQSELYYYRYYSDNPIKLDFHYDIFKELYTSLKKYHAEKFEFIETELYNRQNLFDLDYSDLNDDNIPSPLQQSISRLTDAVKNYNLESFQEIKKELISGKFQIGSDTHTVITYYLQNLISRFYNLTNAVNASDIYELYNYAIDTKVLLNNGKLLSLRFDNLINSIASTNTVEETSNFINKWISLVDSPNREAFKALADAKNLYFHQQYADISNTLIFHNYSKPNQKIMAIGLVLISLYEDPTVDYDTAINYCNNMKRTLRRNKESIGQIFYKSCINFIKIIEQLNKKRTKTLDINLENYHPLFFKSWVLQKIK